MMPQYKLTYFNSRGLAEPIRLMFAYLSVPYEDNRVSIEQWTELKNITPYAKLPTLEVDGKVICQSRAITRFLARKYNLVGNDEWETLQCDILVDAIGDILIEFGQWRAAEDCEKTKELEAKFRSETMPMYLNNFEKTVTENNGYLLTWSDLYVVSILDSLSTYLKDDFFQNYSGLKNLKEKVYGISTIATWIAKRPVTEF